METIVLILMGILGILIHVMFKFQDVITKIPKNGEPFKERALAAWSKFDLLGNLVYAVIALLVIVLVVTIRDVLNEIGFPITLVTIPFIGYAADSAFKNLSNLKQ